MCVFSVSFFHALCSNWVTAEKTTDLQKEPNRYLKKTRGDDYELYLKYMDDSLVGTHCFTYANGSKIDCCLNGTSICLKRNSANLYLGFLRSCYDDTTHNISVEINVDTLILKILDEHVFLDKDVPNYFFKSK